MARTDEAVLVEDEGPVRMLTLHRPERLNAFTAASYRLLSELLRRADDDPGVRVVVLRGAGRAFSSGVDLHALATRPDDGARELGVHFDELVETLASLRTPLVAAVHGPAVGFGATLLLHCDLVVLADDARLRFPFTSLRTAPEAGSSVLLPAAVGMQRAAGLLFTSRWLGAAEAVDIGLALRHCPPDRLSDEVLELAGDIAAQPPDAVAAAKRLLRAGRVDAVRAASARERLEASHLREVLGPLGPTTPRPAGA